MLNLDDRRGGDKRMYKKFEDVLVKGETGFVCIGLMLLIVTVFAAAVLRFFGIDMSWSTDLAQLAFAWVSFTAVQILLTFLISSKIWMSLISFYTSFANFYNSYPESSFFTCQWLSAICLRITAF